MSIIITLLLLHDVIRVHHLGAIRLHNTNAYDYKISRRDNNFITL